MGSSSDSTSNTWSRVSRKLDMKVGGEIEIEEGGAKTKISPRVTRKGIFVGCTFVTYEVLDELNRLADGLHK